MNDKHIGYLIRLAILIVVYFATARFGLGLSAVSGFATLVWPPTGIALAAVLIFGYRMWPGIAVAAFLVNLITGASPFVALGIAAGNTLEAVAGAYLLNRFIRFRQTLRWLRDVLGLIFIAALASTMVSATIGVTSLLAGGVIDSNAYGVTWFAWWLGDMLGVLVITPLILVWTRRPLPYYPAKKLLEAACLVTLLVVVSAVAFRGFPDLGVAHFKLAYLIFPVLIMIALRFGMRGSVTATFLVAVIAVWGTLASTPPPAENTLSNRLLLVQSFVGVTAVTFMTMAAIVAELVRTQTKTVRLTRQRARLIALNRSKDEFIALASHQLRTPATGVKLYLGMLMDGYAGKLTKSQRDMLGKANESNERQLQVANNLLNVAQIDAGDVALHKEEVDMAALVESIMRDLSPAIDGRKQLLQFKRKGGRCILAADRIKMGMVVENIILNASKYSGSGSTIEVILAKESQRIVLSVKDQGVGIPKHEMKKLFRKFSRINNPLSADVGGMGLGLYWAGKVVDLHGGSIKVESEPEVGSTFTITLPTK